MRTRTMTAMAMMVMTVMTAVAITARPATAATCAPPSLVAVLDRSSSMNGALGSGTKWTAARGALDRVLTLYQDAIGFGLMTFPSPEACGPGVVEVTPGLHRRAAIVGALATPPPEAGNWTPLAETLFAAAEEPAIVLAPRPIHAVVITDGYQWCYPYDPDARTLPIDGVRALLDRGIPTFVVGFGGGVDRPTLAAMAVAGNTARAGCDPTGTNAAAVPCYYQADDASALVAALMEIAAVAAAEVCDGADNDCDGVIDDGAPCPAGASCRGGACVTDVVPAVDAGTCGTSDAGADLGADAGDDGMPAGGCGCGAGDGGGVRDGASAMIAVAAGALLAMRRRRRRGRYARRELDRPHEPHPDELPRRRAPHRGLAVDPDPGVP